MSRGHCNEPIERAECFLLDSWVDRKLGLRLANVIL